MNFSRFFSSSWLFILQNVFCSFLCVCRTRRSSAQQNKRKCNKNKSTHNESWELSVKNSTSIYNLYATSLPFTHNFLSMPKSTMNIYVNNNNNFFLKHSSMNKDNKDWVPTFTTHLTKPYLLMAFKSFDRSNLIGL